MASDAANLTTDACPSAPRESIPPDDQKPSTSSSEPQPKSDTKPKAYIKPTPTGKSRSRKMPRPRKLLSAHAVANVININNSTGIHIGSKYIYNMSRESKDETNAKGEENYIPETPAISILFSRTDVVTKSDVSYVSKHIGKNWRGAFRNLDYSEGQIDQYYEKYCGIGIGEVVYQLLLDWIQLKTDNAKMGILSVALWEAPEKALVQLMAKNTVQKQARINW